MTDRPILFSAPMVRALLAGRKTQTRRVAQVKKGVLIQDIDEWKPEPNGFRRAVFTRDQIADPRFAVGDRLWVREEWGTTSDLSSVAPSELPRDARIFYQPRASYPAHDPFQSRIRASMHMPRWVSRLTLPVTDVRVQRLQDISAADAEAEGVNCAGPVAVNCYRVLWDSLNADRGFGWESNPWVVAVSFTVEKRNIDARAA